MTTTPPVEPTPSVTVTPPAEPTVTTSPEPTPTPTEEPVVVVTITPTVDPTPVVESTPAPAPAPVPTPEPEPTPAPVVEVVVVRRDPVAIPGPVTGVIPTPEPSVEPQVTAPRERDYNEMFEIDVTALQQFLTGSEKQASEMMMRRTSRFASQTVKFGFGSKSISREISAALNQLRQKSLSQMVDARVTVVIRHHSVPAKLSHQRAQAVENEVRQQLQAKGVRIDKVVFDYTSEILKSKVRVGIRAEGATN